MKAIFSLRVSV